MKPIRQGRHVARLAEGSRDLARAQALRWQAFRTARGLAAGPGLDRDGFDDRCRHLLVETEGEVTACLRLMTFAGGPEAAKGYSAQFYDLSPLGAIAGPMAEVGRFCLHPSCRDPDLPRLVWAALARLAEAEGIGFLFGCTSLAGADPARHGAALALLGRDHLGPPGLRPPPRAGASVPLPVAHAGARGEAGLPALLRSYLSLGGWVADHAVIDRTLDTLLVFTALDIASVPPARVRALRRIADETA